MIPRAHGEPDAGQAVRGREDASPRASDAWREMADRAAFGFAVIEGKEQRIRYANPAFHRMMRPPSSGCGSIRHCSALPEPVRRTLFSLVRTARESGGSPDPVDFRMPQGGGIVTVRAYAWPLAEASSSDQRVAIQTLEIGHEHGIDAGLSDGIREPNPCLVPEASLHGEGSEGFGAVERELLAANEKLREMAFTDELTGLHNARYFWNSLREEVDRARRDGTVLSLVLFDLDDFKEINDRFGHRVGDHALVMVGWTFREAIRQGETAARVGGEEIALLLPHVGSGEAAEIAQRIRRRIHERPIALSSRDSETIRITASAGAASSADYPGTGAEDLYIHADRALYAAKHAGRNRIALARRTSDAIVFRSG